MYAQERQQAMVQLVTERGRRSVTELAEAPRGGVAGTFSPAAYFLGFLNCRVRWGPDRNFGPKIMFSTLP